MKPFVKNILYVVACAILGVMLGNAVFQLTNKRRVNVKTTVSLNKMDALLNLIGTRYVEDVDQKAIVEKMMPLIVGELDPHSTYLSKEEMAKADEEMDGSFSGVGIQFNIREDTVRVISVVSNGPAEKAGMRAGDCIVAIDDSVFTGKKINNDLVMKTLRGKKHTKVSVGVKRRGEPDILTYVLERDDIPVNSVDASYVIDDRIAYIKIGNFSRTTYAEFLNLVNKMQSQNHCDRLIIDLRGNPGGLMGSALSILNELLPKNRLMLYVEGKAYPRENSYSDGRGSFTKMPVIVLMDDFSASASEIVAGAIQDNDRGYIVGRRSYGKGLVQQQIPFRDGSAVRLTVAHYYIPSGRCVQKPYNKGDFEDYEMDLMNRYEHGEFSHADSIRVNDSLRFETVGGRTVYGGGGILPDFFVPIDTLNNTHWLTSVVNRNLIYTFAASYADDHRETLSGFKTLAQLKAHLDGQPMVQQMTAYAKAKGVAENKREIKQSEQEIRIQTYAYIARNILGEDAFWEMLQSDDNTLLKAVELIGDMGVCVCP